MKTLVSALLLALGLMCFGAAFAQAAPDAATVVAAAAAATVIIVVAAAAAAASVIIVVAVVVVIRVVAATPTPTAPLMTRAIADRPGRDRRTRALTHQIAQQFAVSRVDDDLALLAGPAAGHDHLAQQAAPDLDLTISLIGQLADHLPGIIGRSPRHAARKDKHHDKQQRVKTGA